MSYLRTLGLLVFLLFTVPSPVKAQFLWAELGVDGLTCSACSRSVEMSLRKLSFVDSVDMNLEHTQGKIFFKKNGIVDADKIAQAVVDAGFSVRFLRADFSFTSIPENAQFTFENTKYQLIKTADKKINKETILTFIGKNFLSKKEFSHWKNELKNFPVSKKEKTYFVTL
jgi:copper chaperone CopZ